MYNSWSWVYINNSIVLNYLKDDNPSPDTYLKFNIVQKNISYKLYLTIN